MMIFDQAPRRYDLECTVRMYVQLCSRVMYPFFTIEIIATGFLLQNNTAGNKNEA